MSEPSKLEVRGLSKSFGALKAIDNVTFSVAEGSLVGLIGPNGSGKSTLFNIIAGFIPADEGEVYFGGKKITKLPPYKISQLGLVKGFQTARNFLRMTVAENVLLSPKDQRGELMRIAPFHRRWAEQEEQLGRLIVPWLSTLRLTGNATSKASELSGGQMKLLDILRGVMTSPKFLLLDEPTAGVAPKLADEIFGRILEIRARVNSGFIIIEHRVETLLRYVDRVIVMHLGQVIYDGSPQDVVANPHVKQVYLGE